MVREEIVAGLRNAVERGQTIQQAMQSMINAGYQLNEIQEASGYVNMGAIGSMQQVPQAYVSQEQYNPSSEESTIQAPANNKKSAPNIKVIILVLILVLLLAGVGTMIYFMLKS